MKLSKNGSAVVRKKPLALNICNFTKQWSSVREECEEATRVLL